MLVVDVIGSNKTKRDIAYNVVHFMLQKLLPRLRNIEIEVKFSKMNDDAVGYCMMLDTNREYQLEISKDLNIKELVMTICHEMVHVKQYVRNEMKEGQMVWKKRPIASDTKYYDLPWEKEAYSMQASLAKACWNKGIF